MNVQASLRCVCLCVRQPITSTDGGCSHLKKAEAGRLIDQIDFFAQNNPPSSV